MSEHGWEFFRHEGRIGTGDWDVFPASRVPEVQDAAREWASALAGVERPWLCWSVDAAWCYVQQQLVEAAGWTPVVGTDGTTPPPPLVERAIFVDFNNRLRLPGMWMHFVLEFVFLFTDRLAFWHSDVLPPARVMQKLAAQFGAIEQGELIATRRTVSVLYALRRLAQGKRIRGVSGWSEFVGCTTRSASRNQFENGCGWWRGLANHPNASPRVIAQNPYWEHGIGIRHWQRLLGGRVTPVSVDIDPYHYSRAGREGRRYRRQMMGSQQFGSKASELSTNFDLKAIVRDLESSIRLPDGYD